MFEFSFEHVMSSCRLRIHIHAGSAYLGSRNTVFPESNELKEDDEYTVGLKQRAPLPPVFVLAHVPSLVTVPISSPPTCTSPPAPLMISLCYMQLATQEIGGRAHDTVLRSSLHE
jgi:hypothetical protein